MFDERTRFQDSLSEVRSLTWQTAGLTLQNLHRLASSLNTPDKELTPVQGWFELASIYSAEVLLNKEVINSLKREFVGVVKCVGFGAVIEREAFDSVVGRVIGEHILVI